MTDIFPSMSQQLSKASQEEAKQLAALIAEARKAKAASKFSQLDKYRDVLIKERPKASIREITEAVVRLGIDVSEETVRLWFQHNAVAPKTTMPPKQTKRTGSSDGLKTAVPVPPPTRGPRIARDDI